MAFSENCRKCPRLAGFLEEVRTEHPDYHARPVSPFGVDNPSLLIIGLAPGMHGANRSGRPFTGDYAGILLYQTLHKFGLSSAPQSVGREDGLQLFNCRITNAVKCLPPQNKPQTDEIKCCNQYLSEELQSLAAGSVLLALGAIAHQAVLRAVGARRSQYVFGHGARHSLPGGLVLIDSYHCSRYNTQTRRLTSVDFYNVFRTIRSELD